MCGILGFVKKKGSPRSLIDDKRMLLRGLQAQSYRGHDSAGIAIYEDKRPLYVRKAVGHVDNLVQKVLQDESHSMEQEAVVALGQNRWATNGIPSEQNAHPHVSTSISCPDSSFVVVHNGIITNYTDWKSILQDKGYIFYSETDTEVIPYLCQYIADNHPLYSFPEIVQECLRRLEGTFAILVFWTRVPGQLIGARRGSPLIMGKTSRCRLPDDIKSASHRSPMWAEEVQLQKVQSGTVDDGEFVFASDTVALAGWVDHVIYLEDHDMVHIDDTGAMIMYSLVQNVSGNRKVMPLDMEVDAVSKKHYDSFMMKEICEQPESLIMTMAGRLFQDDHGEYHIKLRGIEDFKTRILTTCKRVVFIACGTSFHAALAVRTLYERILQMPVCLEIASDMMDRSPPIGESDLCVFISQSGETADTLSTLHYCRSRGALCAGVVNRPGSAIARGTDFGAYLNCGVEIGVASTKAYTSQICVLAMMAAALCKDQQPLLQSMSNISLLVKKTIETIQPLVEKLSKDILKKYKILPPMLIVGRGYEVATCHEGALKIKEVSYVHVTAIPAGELKHGPLALVDESTLIFVIITESNVRQSMISAVEQIMARGGTPIIIGHGDDTWITERSLMYIPVEKASHSALQPIITILPFQLLSYYLAKDMGYNVDKPRNLAKSVTVG
jgi:glutamine---fructose-6-phosphate transaminase (isomerizing)